MAAFNFCFDTLRSGGHFVCKFYQGAEDKELERKLKRLFERVHRSKPPTSRIVSISPPLGSSALMDCDRSPTSHSSLRYAGEGRSPGTMFLKNN